MIERLVDSFLNPVVLEASVPYLVRGLLVTLEVCALVIPLGIAGGLSLALAYRTRSRLWRGLLIAFIDFFRAFPPLVLLVFVFYGLPFAGIEIGSLAAVTIAFSLNTSSFYGEIFRAGIESVDRGQWEAARATGLGGFRTTTAVILPQAVRNVLPDLIGNTLEVVKLTSLASVVALPELLRMARVSQGLTYNPTPLVVAAGIYLVLLWPFVRLLSLMERRLAVTA